MSNNVNKYQEMEINIIISIEITRNLKKSFFLFHGMSRNIRKCQEIARNAQKCQEMTRNV